MLRATLVHAAAGALAAVVLAGSGTAQAVPDRNPGTRAADSAARAASTLSCRGGVLGVTADRHVVSNSIVNGKVVSTRTSGKQLAFDVTALGYRASNTTARRGVFEANVVAANGVPRRVTMTQRTDSDNIGLDTNRYDQDGFTPRLFADGYTYFAYTVNQSGTLHRWSLTKYADGDLRYAQKVMVGTGYDKLTSLQASYSFKKTGVWREYLYATTEDGALKQIAVPHARPAQERVRTLRKSGYAGVTELAWAYCNDEVSHALVFAVDPVAGTATWTTVKKSVADPRTRLRGEVTGQDVSWDLTAAY